jgi:hypothetical protein
MKGILVKGGLTKLSLCSFHRPRISEVHGWLTVFLQGFEEARIKVSAATVFLLFY